MGALRVFGKLWPGPRGTPAGASLRAEAGGGPRLGRQRRPQGAEIASNLPDVLVLKRRREALHDRVLAAALLVLLDGPHQVILVLAGEGGINRGDGDTVLSVAGGAKRGSLRHGALRLAGRGEGLAGEIAGDVEDVLVGQRGGLRMHRQMRAVAVAIAMQRCGEVVRSLPLEFRHAVVRIGVLVAVDPVAAEAGVGEGLAPVEVTRGGSGRLLRAGDACERPQCDCRDRNRVHGRTSRASHPALPASQNGPNLTDSPGQMPHNRPAMIALIQRVSEAQVSVGGERVSAIGRGVLALIGVRHADTDAAVGRLLARLLSYRVFPDSEGRMNLSVREIGGGLLLVPQFTLAADTNKGSRAGFSTAAPPELARRLFSQLLERAQAAYAPVSAGVFGADMQVSLINDGPVTFWLETP